MRSAAWASEAMKLIAALMLPLLAGLGACTPDGEPGTPATEAPATDALSAIERAKVEQVAAQRAATALAPFKSGLMTALQAGLAESPIAAIAVCQIEAPQIAARASSADLRIGRSSHRVRNLDNAPAPWMQAVIDAYLANPDDREPRLIDLADDQLGYAEPILMQPLCAACHGDAITPDLQAAIDERYPHDQATGFAVGELRGIFWVTLDRPAPPATGGG